MKKRYRQSAETQAGASLPAPGRMPSLPHDAPPFHSFPSLLGCVLSGAVSPRAQTAAQSDAAAQLASLNQKDRRAEHKDRRAFPADSEAATGWSSRQEARPVRARLAPAAPRSVASSASPPPAADRYPRRDPRRNPHLHRPAIQSRHRRAAETQSHRERPETADRPDPRHSRLPDHPAPTASPNE